ncbi:MAG: sigma-70 family RNA polymerase sigma factor [Candidatus Sumerlaeia bacterium]|nr:sigma-70 family RNA polymerase sigma factor [Candidatus Sumerlaeia bacterium]
MTGSALATVREADVLAAARGDEAAFERLVAATQRLVCSIALAATRDHDASEDVAQEVYVAAWRNLPKLRNAASFLPWLRQLARQRAAAFLRGAGRLRARHEAAAALAGEAHDPRPGIQAALDADREADALARALDELPDDAREVLILYYREGRSVAQVAELLELSEDAVKQRLSRARRKLRDAALERLGESLSRTAPGAAFTGAVMAALVGATPATAAAATATAAGVLQAGGLGALGKVLAPFAGALAGLAGGLLGAHYGTRQLVAEAAPGAERAGFVAFRRALFALIVAGCAGFVATGLAPEGWRWALYVSSGLLFFGGMNAMYFLWYPGILRLRHARELAEDPAGAPARHRREARAAAWGYWGGQLSGFAGYLAGGWVLL